MRSSERSIYQEIKYSLSTVLIAAALLGFPVDADANSSTQPATTHQSDLLQQDEPPLAETAISSSSPAEQGQFPWMADVDENCSGVRVAPEWIVTAAHCIYNKTPETTIISVGGVKANVTEPGEVFVTAQEFFFPSSPYEYNPRSGANDIAWMLVPYIEDSSVIGSLDLYEGETITQTEGAVVGWGNTQTFQFFQGNLNYIEGLFDCDTYSTWAISCNIADKPSAGLCKRDSGGALVKKEENEWKLYGIGSRANECDRIPRVSVYTPILTHLDGIKASIAEVEARKEKMYMPAIRLNHTP